MIKKFKVLFTIFLFIVSQACTDRANSTDEDYRKTPVFLVHGLGLTERYWKNLVEFLKRNGYPNNYIETINLKPTDASNIYHAEKLIAPKIEQFLESINKSKKNRDGGNVKEINKVDIISHSMGSVSARWYSTIIRPERVRKWISLAGANHGSNAGCQFPEPGPQETCPAFSSESKKNPLQIKLNGMPYIADVDETPYGIGIDSNGVMSVKPNKIISIHYVTMRIEPDKWIQPEESTILDGAGGIKLGIPDLLNIEETSEGNYLLNNCNSHDGIVSCREAMELVLIILNSK